MLLLLTISLPTLERIAPKSPYLGRLFTPRHSSRVADTGERFPWAADNDAYGAWDERAWLLMLDRIAGAHGCLFATAPDVVGAAGPTLERFEQYLPELRSRALPVALVGQDGMTSEQVPWSELAAFFVGGSTEWKLGAEARALMREASSRGLWVHMGRVNTKRRLVYAQSTGVDSVDGSGWSRWRDTELVPRLGMLQGQRQQRFGEP